MDNYSISALAAEQLKAEYIQNKNPSVVLDRIHFALNEGEILTLPGEGGSRKSTCGKVFVEVLPPSAKIESGLIRTGDHDLTDLSDIHINWNLARGIRIGMIYQDAQLVLNPAKTIRAHFQETLRKRSSQSKNELEKVCYDMFQLLSFDDPKRIMNAYPFELSDGTCQRVHITMALILEPEVPITDEPTSVLDVVSQREVLQLLRRIQRERKLSILLITRDIGVVHEISDRVIVLKDDEIIEEGAVRDILRDPRGGYTGQLVDVRKSTVLLGLQSHKQKEVPLQIKGLEKTFQDRTKQKNILNQVDSDLHRGETMGILGFSDCEKSTLARRITGIGGPDHGKILYRGQDISGLHGKRRKCICKAL